MLPRSPLSRRDLVHAPHTPAVTGFRVSNGGVFTEADASIQGIILVDGCWLGGLSFYGSSAFASLQFGKWVRVEWKSSRFLW